MALLSTIDCKTCGQRKQAWHSGGSFPPDVCNECEAQAAEEAKRAELEAIAARTTDARLRLIEEWIYEHQRNHPRRDVRF